MDLIDKTRIDKYIELVRWWYMELEDEFIWFVNYIRANGVKEWFYKSQHIYFYYYGLKYWTDPIDNTWVLNRTDDMKIYK